MTHFESYMSSVLVKEVDGGLGPIPQNFFDLLDGAVKGGLGSE